MNTHLSEASVNSLLSLVKGANTSRSYDDKINILTKAGILQGGQKYSSRVAVTTLPDYTVQVPADGANLTLAGLADASNLAGGKVWIAYQNLQKFVTLANRTRGLHAVPQDAFAPVLNALAAGTAFANPSSVDASVTAAFANTAGVLDFDLGGTAYTDALSWVKSNGLVKELATLKKCQSDPLTNPAFLAEIVALLLLLLELGLLIDEIIKQGSAYLSTIPDGKYNFTVFPANTAQPVILTGTAVITSQYDQYSSILLQKLINNTIVGTPPITALQTLDISYNSRQVDTTGSSSTGKYTVAGNTATITSNGYSKAVGAFVDTETIIITFPAVFYVINNIINQDKSKTTISLTYYTRQLTSGELDALIDRLFDTADTNGDGKISQAEFNQGLAAVAAGVFFAADQNGDGVISRPEAKPAIQGVFAAAYGALQYGIGVAPQA